MFDFLRRRLRRKAARQEVRQLLAAFATATTADEAERTLDALRALATTGVIPEPEMHAAYVASYAIYTDSSIRDDQLNEAEAHVLNGIFHEIGELRTEDVVSGDFVRANNRVQACLINTLGPTLVSSSLGGGDEKVYWIGNVQLMRQKRTFRGHSPSVSVPLGKGVRFRWSLFEGAPAYSTDYTTVDAGTFAVTPDELFFLGAHKTINTELNDVLQIDLLADGFRIHSSRRERVDMFATEEAPVAVATIQWLLAHDDESTPEAG